LGLFEELIGKYPLEDVPPLGSCLVIPSSEFKREWEERLKAEGCKVYVQAYGGQACFFIKPPSVSNKQAAQSAEAAEPKTGGKIDWTPELIEKLKALRAEGLGYRSIARKLGLSPDAVYKQLRILGLSGPIRGKKPAGGRQRQKEVKAEPASQTTAPQENSALDELIQALRLLHERGFKRACLILLQNAETFLEAPHHQANK